MGQREKRIADYFKFYIGCDVVAPDPDDESVLTNGRLTGISGLGFAEIQFIINGHASEEPSDISFDTVKLCLRPLSDMTEEEREEYKSVAELNLTPRPLYLHDDVRKIAIAIKWLHSKGFDLYNLIESGIALDSTQ